MIQMAKVKRDLAKVVEEAVKAVEKVADPKLRSVAFDRVLEHLLQATASTATSGTTKVKTTKAKQLSTAKLGPKSWIEELIEHGFFEKPKSGKAILEELDKQGHILKQSDITAPLSQLVIEHRLRRQKLKQEEGGRTLLHWHNW
jgi:hypothetical protein